MPIEYLHDKSRYFVVTSVASFVCSISESTKTFPGTQSVCVPVMVTEMLQASKQRDQRWANHLFWVETVKHTLQPELYRHQLRFGVFVYCCLICCQTVFAVVGF